jgi:hypothetical protein
VIVGEVEGYRAAVIGVRAGLLDIVSTVHVDLPESVGKSFANLSGRCGWLLLIVGNILAEYRAVANAFVEVIHFIHRRTHGLGDS